MAKEEPDTDHADIIALPPVIYLTFLLIGIAMKWLLGGTIGLPVGVRTGLGVLSMLVSIGLFYVFMRSFSPSDQDPNPRTTTPRVLIDGLYRFSRNPAYVAFNAMQLGLALLLNNVWLLVLLIPAVVVMHYGVIKPEEAYLERKFGDAYLRYKERVRRWL